MSFTFLYHAAAYFSIVAGLCFLSIGIILREWFFKGGVLRKKYLGDYSLIVYIMIGLLFIAGGITVIVTK